MRVVAAIAALGLMLGGCASTTARTVRGVESVQITNGEPGGACRLIDALEVRSGRGDGLVADALRCCALAEGADWIVLDAFTVAERGDESVAVARARLFSCDH